MVGFSEVLAGAVAGAGEVSYAVHMAEQDKKEMIQLEEKVGLAVAPIMKLGIDLGLLTGDFTDENFVQNLWVVADKVSDAFENNLISTRLVYQYILKTKHPLTWQIGSLRPLSPDNMRALLDKEENLMLMESTFLARRF